ncbi:transposase [Francisella tularensis]|uniref:transposase n=1 Tax=Francisella tularensis TaxID=263 RepID=UPI00131A2829|nr:transposase [Francisella tularensis]
MKIDFDAITEFNVRQLLSPKSKFNFIKNNINILVFSAVYKGIAIPLYYKLDHRGNSDSQTRIDLVKKFVNKFGKECIGSILGDREFIGKQWLTWLDSQQISYIIRIRNNSVIMDSNAGEPKVSKLFYSTSMHEHKNLTKLQQLGGIDVYLSGTRTNDGELFIVASNYCYVEQLIPTYGLRWEIENLF